MSFCKLCPRNCQANREKKQLGFCSAGEKVRLARVMLHQWEEPCFVGKTGAGAVFFSHCNLRCVFCQNFSISHKNFGIDISIERLAEIFLTLQKQNAATLDLVTPTHFTPQILKALVLAKQQNFSLPVVWNSNAYEKKEVLDELKGHVSVFLPDLKFFDEKVSQRYAQAPDYFFYASQAIQKMVELTGACQLDEKKILSQGVLVRHLVLPSLRKDSIKILSWLWENFGNKIFVSIMNQYVPYYRSHEFPEINRQLTTFEYNSVVRHAEKLGFTNVFIQEKSSATKDFIPSFNGEGVL